MEFDVFGGGEGWRDLGRGRRDAGRGCDGEGEGKGGRRGGVRREVDSLQWSEAGVVLMCSLGCSSGVQLVLGGYSGYDAEALPVVLLSGYNTVS